MNSKTLITFFVITLFACTQLAKCAPVGESTIQTTIFTKPSTNNANPASASASSSNEFGNAISPLNNEPDILGALAPSRHSRRNRVSYPSQIKFPILTHSSFANFYNSTHETQRDDAIKTAEIEAGDNGDELYVNYTLLSESELGEYSESYEGGDLSHSESEEDDDGDIFIDCTSSGCSEVDEIEIPSKRMQLIIPRIGDDDGTMTIGELDVMNDFFMEMASMRLCIQMYKYKFTKNASITGSPTISSSTTFNKFEFFSNILECKIWMGTLQSYIEDTFSQATMSPDIQSNLNKPIGPITTEDPASSLQQLPAEDHDEDDEEQALSVLFASKFGITTLPTSNDDSSHPEKAVLEQFSMEDEEVDPASEPNDLKPSTLGFDEPPKNLLQNEDEHYVPENETLILIIEQGISDTAHSNPKKNLFHPLLIFPILLCSLVFSCILGTTYNKYLGRSEDRTKILKVPRMAIFSDAPLNSILFPPVTEAKVHSMKKQGIEIV